VIIYRGIGEKCHDTAYIQDPRHAVFPVILQHTDGHISQYHHTIQKGKKIITGKYIQKGKEQLQWHTQQNPKIDGLDLPGVFKRMSFDHTNMQQPPYIFPQAYRF
jgi:hypothetical protein